MRTSEKGIAFIAAHEGVVTRAYRDVAGVWTIGVGHTANAGPPAPVAGMKITRDEAMTIFRRDLAKFEKRVNAAFGIALQEARSAEKSTSDISDVPATGATGIAQNEFDGAVSFDFNTGAIHRASWVKAFRAGDVERARAGLMKWVKAGGRTIAGLARRRAAEARLIFSGEYGPDSTGASPRVAASRAPEEVKRLQTALARPSLYDGPIDGIAGAKTRLAVRAYQRRHPDLVNDGIAGPATHASLARDMAARNRVGQSVGGAIATAVAGGTAATAGGASHPVLIAVLVSLAALIVIGGAFTWGYRAELGRLFKITE